MPSVGKALPLYRRRLLGKRFPGGSQQVVLIADAARELDAVEIFQYFDRKRPADARAIAQLRRGNRAACSRFCIVCRDFFGEPRMFTETSRREEAIVRDARQKP